MRPSVYALLLSGLLLCPACSDLSYYGQAISGQWQLLSGRQPVEQLLADPALEPRLRERLQQALSIREFAIQKLGLPDNGSYRSYVDLQRPFVVRNVFATPELSLEPLQWCFPIAGCVSYRGYFEFASAAKLAEDLRAKGYDVFVGNVPAYSTLGWFDDPLLNTFVEWPLGRFAELLFHELAHQRVYIAGDTAFNESFAAFVGGTGALRWLQEHGSPQQQAGYEQYIDYRADFLEQALATKQRLAETYAASLPISAKRLAKRDLLNDLQASYEALKTRRWNGFSGYDLWFEDLNNAKLAALQAYTRYIPAFARIFADVDADWHRFYRRVDELGHLPAAQRNTLLEQLMNEPRKPS